MLKKVERYDNIITYERMIRGMSGTSRRNRNVQNGQNNTPQNGGGNNSGANAPTGQNDNQPNEGENNSGANIPTGQNSIPQNGIWIPAGQNGILQNGVWIPTGQNGILQNVVQMQTEQNNTPQNGREGNSKSILAQIGHWATIIVAILGIIGAVYAVVMSIFVPISNHTNNIEEINSEIKEINSDIKGLETKIDKLSTFVYLNIGSNNSDGDTASAISIEFDKGYSPTMKLGSNDTVLSEPAWTSSDTEVATLVLNNSSIRCTAGDLQNRRIVTMYEEGESEVYFLGKYNKNNQWDGECVLNVYNSNELIAVFEGIYENGDLIKYKRVSCDEVGQWTVMVRTVHKDENGKEYTDGETWEYKKNKSFPKKIKSEDFEESQILRTIEILGDIDEDIIKYYKGQVSDGRYNDQTGNACIVTYVDGKVNYLYVGKVKDGFPCDDTENAWCIGWGHANEGYYYYDGKFGNENKENEEPSNEGKLMTEQEIRNTVNPEQFNCPLTGLIDN